MSIEFKAQHFDLLEDAVKALGYTPQRSGNSLSFYGRSGTVTIRDGQINLNERDRGLIDPLKREYSKEILKRASSRYGWALKETKANIFVANKR